VVTGEVWSFTIAAVPPATNANYEWTFDRGDLSAAIGRGVMEYADGATPGLTSFGTTDGETVPHIGGQPATYLHVPAFTGLGNGYCVSFTDSGPNGGGTYINRFTFIADVLIPGSLNWTPLFNTNPGNANDADFYVDPTGRLGIGDLGYSGAGAVAVNTWFRVAFAANLGAGIVTYHRNGTQVFQRTGASLLDGRFALYSNNDSGPDLLLFNEGVAGVYTHELYVSSIAFTDRTMTAAEIAALGGPKTEGIFVQRLRGTYNGTNLVVTWTGLPNVRLQKTVSVSNPNWQDVPGTLGASSFTETAPDRMAFYRLFGQ